MYCGNCTTQCPQAVTQCAAGVAPRGGGEEKKFSHRVGYFFPGLTPPRGVGYEKKWVLQKKNFLPMSHVPHIITVFPPHNMPLLLVGIPLCGYFGY